MPTAFDEIEKGLADLRGSAGDAITYSTPAGSVSLIAVKSIGGRTLLGPDGQAQIAFEPVVWQIKRADLVIESTLVTPARGHRITDSNNVVYEVDFPGGDDVYLTMDANRSTLKVITKRIA
jgi:hypothetical protein